MKKLICLALVLVMLAVTMVGCGAKDKKDGFTFGATYWTMNNPYFIALEEGIRATVEADGHQLISYDPQGDVTTQISQIEDLIAVATSQIGYTERVLSGRVVIWSLFLSLQKRTICLLLRIMPRHWVQNTHSATALRQRPVQWEI